MDPKKGSTGLSDYPSENPSSFSGTQTQLLNLPPSPSQYPSPTLPPRPIYPWATFVYLPPPSSNIDTSIRLACNRATSLIKEGNLLLGLQDMEESMSSHEKNVVLLRTRAYMHFHIRELRKCVRYAQESIDLCPNLIGLMVLRSISLFWLAKVEKDYENVIEQCLKGLSIEDPIDPAMDVVICRKLTERENRLSNEARIDDARLEMSSLIQRSKKIIKKKRERHEEIWRRKGKQKVDPMPERCKKIVQSVGDEEKRRSLISLKIAQSVSEEEKRRSLISLIKSRESNEAKIEAIEKELSRVMACELEIYKGGITEKEKETEELWEEIWSRLQVGRKSRVQLCWKGLSGQEQSDLLQINVCDLENFYTNYKSSAEVLKEAIGYMKLGFSKFWECRSCRQRFLDGELWNQHLDSEDHLGVLSAEYGEILPEELDVASLNNKMPKRIPEEASARPSIFYTDDILLLSLDDQLQSGDFQPEGSRSLNEKNFVDWLYEGGSETEELAKFWEDVTDQKSDIETSAYMFICQVLKHLELLCKQKSRLLNYKRDIDVIRDTSLEEIRRTEGTNSHEPLNLYQLLLLQRDIITGILANASVACTACLGPEGALFDIDPVEFDSGAREGPMKDRQLVNRADNAVLEVMEKKRIEIERKLCNVDASIMKSRADIDRMRHNLGLLAAHDLQGIMFLLLKPYIRERLETCSYNVAEEEAEAAEEALLRTPVCGIIPCHYADPMQKQVGDEVRRYINLFGGSRVMLCQLLVQRDGVISRRQEIEVIENHITGMMIQSTLEEMDLSWIYELRRNKREVQSNLKDYIDGERDFDEELAKKVEAEIQICSEFQKKAEDLLCWGRGVCTVTTEKELKLLEEFTDNNATCLPIISEDAWQLIDLVASGNSKMRRALLFRLSQVPSTVAAKINWPVPTTIKELREFLVLTSYYCKFVKGQGHINKSLTDLLKRISFTWSEEAEQALYS